MSHVVTRGERGTENDFVSLHFFSQSLGVLLGFSRHIARLFYTPCRGNSEDCTQAGQMKKNLTCVRYSTERSVRRATLLTLNPIWVPLFFQNRLRHSLLRLRKDFAYVTSNAQMMHNLLILREQKATPTVRIRRHLSRSALGVVSLVRKGVATFLVVALVALVVLTLTLLIFVGYPFVQEYWTHTKLICYMYHSD